MDSNPVQPNTSEQPSENVQPEIPKNTRSVSLPMIVLITVVITAIVVGSGVYAWQGLELKSTKAALQQQITNLQNQIDQISKENTERNQDNSNIRPTTTVEPKLPTNKTECESAGGKWGQQGLLEREFCNLLATDFGKKCSDSDECQGKCIATITQQEEELLKQGQALEMSGSCSKWHTTFGCLPFVQNGVVSGILCVD